MRKDRITAILSKYPPEAVEFIMPTFQDIIRSRNGKKSEKQTRRERGLSSLSSFIEIYFSHYFYVDLGIQQKELIRDIQRFTGRTKREPLKLLRALSRGFGKSTLMSLVGVLWLLLKKEWHFVIMVSSTRDAAEGFLRKIIEETEDNELLISDFPELKPAIDQKGQTVSWKDADVVFRGGFRIIAKGFLNAIRGQRHKQYRPSALIIDDPDEEKDVSSESTMQRKYRWLDRAALRLGTAWGIDVMCAYTTISPNCVGEMIYSNQKYADWDRKKYKAIEVDKYGREYSTWEAGAPLKKLLIERDGDPSVGKEGDPITFARERQNEVLAEIDQKFKGYVRTYSFNRVEIESWRKVIVVDLSLGKSESSDFSAIIGVAVSPQGRYKEIFSSIERRRTNQIVEDLIDVLQLYKNWEICGIESTANQEHFLNTFRLLLDEWNKKNPFRVISVPLIPIINHGDKITRIVGTLQPMFAGGLLEIRDDSERLFKQLDEFPYDKKDGPDALEMGVSYLKSNGISTIHATNDYRDKEFEEEKRKAEEAYQKRMQKFYRGY